MRCRVRTIWPSRISLEAEPDIPRCGRKFTRISAKHNSIAQRPGCRIPHNVSAHPCHRHRPRPARLNLPRHLKGCHAIRNMAKQLVRTSNGGHMRYGVMSILALGLLMGAPAEAARNDQTAARNQARLSATAVHPVTRPAAARSLGHRQAAIRQPAVPYRRASLSSAQQRSAFSRVASACTVSNGRRVCGGTRQVAMRWSGGLMPAAGNQTSCPDGTMATQALGHQNVVRCLPL